MSPTTSNTVLFQMITQSQGDLTTHIAFGDVIWIPHDVSS